jgi:Lrp/AsnC family leucine-responsive transcriptional regulator
MTEELDQKDKKILKELENNCRQSSTRIAKIVGLSKDAVNYRIKNLEKEGIISGYYAVLNITKLGFITYKLMLTFQNTNSNIEKEIINYLQKSQHVGWLVSCDGNYNLMIVTWVKNELVFNNFLIGFLKKYGKYIKQRDVLIIIENHSSRKVYLFGGNRNNEDDIYYGNERESIIDKKEWKTLHLFSNNARTSLSELANKLNITGEAMAHRLKQLQKRNIIQASRPIINTSILGYQYYNILFKLKKFENIEKIFSYFKLQPNIIYFVKYLGNYDIGIDLEVKNSEDLRKILQDIKDKFSEDIESYSSILVYQEHKLSYLPESDT